MRRVENPELRRRIIDHLSDQFGISTVRTGIHLSSLITCRTKAFLDQRGGTQPTEKEVMLFALGYALQDVITPKGASEETYEVDGITYRPDMTFKWAKSEQLVEVKTTRKSIKYHEIDSYLPNTWLEYIMGGCWMRGVKQYDLAVLYIIPPELKVDTIFFNEDDPNELQDNWNVLMERRDVLQSALDSGKMPTPYEHCNSFECKNCRFSMVCNAIAEKEGLDNPELAADQKEW